MRDSYSGEQILPPRAKGLANRARVLSLDSGRRPRGIRRASQWAERRGVMTFVGVSDGD